jgi:hypothetical protein
MRLDHLFPFGTAVLPTDTVMNVGGRTECSVGSGAIVNGQRIPVPDQYHGGMHVDAQ